MGAVDITASQTAASAWTVRRLGGSLAAEIIGCDLNKVDTTTFPEISTLLTAHHVLAFRGQTLSDEGLMKFGNLFGPLRKFAGDKKMTRGDGAIIVLRNEGFAKVSDDWHSDASMAQEPPSVTILRAEKIPEAGGDTVFANQHLAFEKLSPVMQGLLRSLQGIHHVSYQGAAPDIRTAHPVVRTHPISGKEALYLGKLVRQFEGMTVEESKPILDYLYLHSTDADVSYRHQWQTGDVVMWDNRSVLHRATRDYGEDPEARIVSNVQSGSEPVR